jgi:hypothetical protein
MRVYSALPEGQPTDVGPTITGNSLTLTEVGFSISRNLDGGQAICDSGLGIVAHDDNLDSTLDRVAKFQAPNSAEDDHTLLEIRYVGLVGSAD